MSCDALEADVVRQLEGVENVTRAWATVAGTTCEGHLGGDVVEYPSMNVSVVPDITADELVAVHGAMREAYSVLIAPRVSNIEDFTIHVDGVAELSWLGYTPLEATLATAILEPTSPDRFVQVSFESLAMPDGSPEYAGSTPRDPLVAMYVDASTAQDEATMEALLAAAWDDAQSLAAQLGGSATLDAVDGSEIRGAQTTGINLSFTVGSFLRLDVAPTGGLPSGFAAVAVRTMDFEDQPELHKGEIHARDEGAYARFVFADGHSAISDETQRILDDITAQLDAMGIEIERVSTL